MKADADSVIIEPYRNWNAKADDYNEKSKKVIIEPYRNWNELLTE